MLNKFTYQLELNELNKINTRQALKELIIKYNRASFNITSGQKIQISLPWYNNIKNTERTISIGLNFQLLQLALAKYNKLFDITELPMYAQNISKLNFNITLKETTNG